MSAMLTVNGHSGTLRRAASRCSISVASTTETKQAITAGGGVVSGPAFELPGVGKILNFEDPEGNVVAAV